VTDALYAADGDSFVPSAFTRGPWSPDHQHAGPPSALLARALAGASRIVGGQTVRIAFDILRPVPIVPLTIATRPLRPGRNVEQLEATLALAADGTELMRARAWRMRADPIVLDDGLSDPSGGPAPPEDFEAAPRAGFFGPETAYADAIEWRFVRGTWDAPGPAGAWTRMKVDLVAGETVAPLEHLLVAGDAASGISASLDWKTWNFINVDFSVSLEREPAGDWIAMDAVTRFGTQGAAAAHCEYADRDGRVGTSTQALLVSRQGRAARARRP